MKESTQYQYIEIIKRLTSSLEGAPFPTNVNRELYQIWYEHSRQAADEALRFLARRDSPDEREGLDLPSD